MLSPTGTPLFPSLLATSLSIYGRLSTFVLSFTLCRLFLALSLLPPYSLKLIIKSLPTIARNARYLLSSKGREKLVADTDQYRELAQRIAKQQLDGTYEFRQSDLYSGANGQIKHLLWAVETEEFVVCGATARFIHLNKNVLDDKVDNNHRRPIVFLHGNPSWSYMWRKVIRPLAEQGYEIYALDWLGHGRSDKITVPELCNFELHMRTLANFFEFNEIKGAILVAHDWGGCIALCTLPSLTHGYVGGLFLLDTFFPPRVSEVSLYCGLLYAIWFLTGGILGPYIPESAVMYFMSPTISLSDVDGYRAPYLGMPESAKASVFRFGHIVPGAPRTLLQSLRYSRWWKLLEGLCGAQNFDILDAQSRLAYLDDNARTFWARGQRKRHIEIVLAYGDMDPLLIDYKRILLGTINARLMAYWAVDGIWLSGGGHYPSEEQAAHIAGLISRLISSVDKETPYEPG